MKEVTDDAMKDDDEDPEADDEGEEDEEGGEDEEDEDLDETGPSVIDDAPMDGSDDALVFEIEQSGQPAGSSTSWMYWALGSFLAVTLGAVFFCRRGRARELGYEPVPN